MIIDENNKLKVENKFNANSILIKYYLNFYRESFLPNNLCTYTWKLLLALICWIFVWTAIYINKKTAPLIYDKINNIYHRNLKTSISTSNGILLNWILLIFGVFLFNNKKIIYIDNLFLSYCLSIITVFIIYHIGFFIIIKSIKNMPKTVKVKKIKKIKIKKEKNPNNIFNLISARYRAFKDNNCPLIEWEYKEKDK